MTRLLKISVLALLILLGAWLVISGIYSFCKIEIGGMWLTSSESCFFIPDVGGWIGRVWQVVVALAGLILVLRAICALAATMELGQPCGCSTGRSYGNCCFRRDRAYLVIIFTAAIAMFSLYAFDISLVPCIGIVVSACLTFWIVSRHYRRVDQPTRKI